MPRPKLPKTKKRTNRVQVSYNDAELRLLERAAGEEFLPSWIRELTLEKARKKR